jgi:hypothetical protein
MTVLGELGIELKTVTLYGTCESYVVFLAEDGSLYRKGPNGQDCFAGPSAEEFLHPGDKAYDEEFQSLYQQILRVREGSACLEPKPELDDLLSFLERFQREPWAKSPSSAFLFK